MKHTILLVEDELGIRETVKIFLKSQNYEVIITGNNNVNINVSNICIPPSLISIVTKNKKIRDEILK